jgi:hypothetical protein
MKRKKIMFASCRFYFPRRFSMVAPAAVFLAAAFACFHGGTARAEEGNLRVEKDQKSFVTILDGRRPVLRYRYQSNPNKPYVDQLFSPSGVQVLRDAVPDHPHHHGLMYALTVDKVNCWEESKTGGRETGKPIAAMQSTVHDGRGRAGFVQQLQWMGPKSDKPLLVERREIDMLTAADLGATLIEWRTHLETPPGKESVKLSGNFYFGLGMRFPASMDAGGRHFNADDKQGEDVRSNSWLTRVRWTAYTAKADGKPVTIAMFDHNDNFRHPAAFYTKEKPFAYLSATLNQWKEPVELKADKPLDLRYGVAVWDGEADKAAVEKLYRRWLELSNRR